jgi:hypothetical protein
MWSYNSALQDVRAVNRHNEAVISDEPIVFAVNFYLWCRHRQQIPSLLHRHLFPKSQSDRFQQQAPLVQLPPVQLPLVQLPLVQLPLVQLLLVQLLLVQLLLVQLPLVQLPLVQLPLVHRRH